MKMNKINFLIFVFDFNYINKNIIIIKYIQY